MSGSPSTCGPGCSTRSASPTSAGRSSGPVSTWASPACTPTSTPWPGSGSCTSTTACGTAAGSCPRAGSPTRPSVQIANPQREEPDWRQGYGFQLWMSRHGYRGDGAFGQYMVVLPEHDAVVAMFSCTEHMQVVLDLDVGAPPAGDGRRTRRRRRPTTPRWPGGWTACRCRRWPSAAAGRPPALPAMTFDPATPGPTRTARCRASRPPADRMIVHEDDRSIDVPLTSEWTVVDPSLAASAARLADGRLVVDLVFLATPHRLEIELDPATAHVRHPLAARPALRRRRRPPSHDDAAVARRLSRHATLHSRHVGVEHAWGDDGMA